MKYYLGGPMRGIPEGNVPAFIDAAKLLRERGFEIFSPVELDSPETLAETMSGKDLETYGGKTPGAILAADICLILDQIEGIIFLPGWEKSFGARLEAYTGLLKGIPMWQLITDEAEVELEELPHPLVAGVCAAQWVPKELLQKVGLAA